MVAPKELQLHTSRTTKPLEWVGLTVVKAWIAATRPDTTVQDVHNNRDWFDRGIDLVLRTGQQVESVDLKVDSYYGTDPAKKKRGHYNIDSGVMLLETTSQLRYDRADLARHPDVPGWFFTSEADSIYYYFIAITTPQGTLKEILNRRRGLESVGVVASVADRELLSKLEVERDELLAYSLPEARRWLVSAPEEAFEGWAGAGNPGYVTVSRRLRRDYLRGVKWCKSYGTIIETARAAGAPPLP